MAKKKEFQIGEEFDFGLIRVKCVEIKKHKDVCPKSCAFRGPECWILRATYIGECGPYERSDGKSVYFKKIAKNK